MRFDKGGEAIPYLISFVPQVEMFLGEYTQCSQHPPALVDQHPEPTPQPSTVQDNGRCFESRRSRCRHFSGREARLQALVS